MRSTRPYTAKDLPSSLPDGLVLGAVPVREDPRDALVTRDGGGLAAIDGGGIIGTGSDRRAAQVAEMRPDIVCRGIRGNVETRLRKLDDGGYDAIILAAAGLKRLGLASRIAELIGTESMVPAPCQGAIGVECRVDDAVTRGLLELIDDTEAALCADAERRFIATLGMGCHAPVGALAEVRDGGLAFRSYVRDPDTGATFRGTLVTTEAEYRTEVVELAEDIRRRMDAGTAD